MHAVRNQPMKTAIQEKRKKPLSGSESSTSNLLMHSSALQNSSQHAAMHVLLFML